MVESPSMNRRDNSVRFYWQFGKVEQAQYECDQRDCMVGRRFTKTEEKTERLREDVGQRFAAKLGIRGSTAFRD